MMNLDYAAAETALLNVPARPSVRTRLPGWMVMLLLLAPAGTAMAQGIFNFPSATAVGTAAQTQTVTVPIAQTGTVASVQVLTQGVANLDYTVASGGSCAAGALYSAGASCTVAVAFQPRYPGARHGAVVLADVNGVSLGTVLLEGVATGSLSVLTPARIDTVAGDYNWTFSGDGYAGTASAIFLPMGEVTDAAGNLYVADTSNSRVRRVDAATGIMTTVAGGYAPGYQGDGGPGTASLLNGPTALAIDGAGNLFIADSGNYVVRMLNTISGIITTVAGAGGASNNPGDGLQATAAHLSAAAGLALDAQHRLYIADTGNNTIRRVDFTTGIITRFAGLYTQGFAGDGGPALGALLSTPQGINFGPDGSLYIADLYNNRIRRIAPNETITTVAGGGSDPLNEGINPLQAQLVLPAGVAIDQAGNLYIADAGSNRIRKVTAATNLLRTIAGDGGETFTGDGKNADQAQIYGPYSIFYDGQGNLFIADMFHNRIREINGSQAVLKYTPIRVNRVSAPQPESLENDGNADLNLTAAVLNGAALEPGTTSCALPGTLPAGMACALGVSFAPTVLGNPATGTVTLPSNAGDSPAVITVTGQSLLVDPTVTTMTSNLNPAGFGVAVTFTAHVTTQGTTLTGPVQFQDGGVTIGAGTLNASHNATFTTSSLAPGPHTMTAVYQGDATNAVSTSAPLIESIKQQTVTVLQSSANPSFESQAITLTAVLTGHGTVPSGDVVFSNGGVALGTVTLDPNGIATFTTATLTIGTHALTVSYGGDATNSASLSNTVQQVVLGQTSTITLASSSLSIPVGSSVAFSVQVTGSNTTVASGLVTYKDGATTIGTATLDATGAASLSTATLTPGSHIITAIYAGDANYAGSTSAALVETVQQIATVTALSSSANPIAAGAAVVLRATVTAAPGTTGGPFAGAVTFLNGGTVLGTGTLSAAGIATLSVSTLPLGPNVLTATYPGSVNFLPSASPGLTETVEQAATTTALATSATPSVAEDTVTFTATVTGVGGRVTGTVTFMDGPATLGQGTVNATGMATFATAKLIVGLHAITATYTGDTLNLPSTSAALGQTVTLRPTSDTLTSSATSLTGGQQVTLISVVQWTGPIVPTGTATFTSGGTVLGTTVVDSTGVATLTLNPQLGQINVVASYSGDSWYAPSTSAGITITVEPSQLFLLSANKTAMSLQSLQHSTVDVTLTSIKGFTDSFALGCLGLPFSATCTFSVDQMTLAANASQTVHVVIDTGSPLTAGPVAQNELPGTATELAWCGLPLGALACLLLRRRLRLRGASRLLLALVALGVMAGLAGCGTISIHGTPPGTYHFQITAEAKGVAVLQSVNMTLTVTQ